MSGKDWIDPVFTKPDAFGMGVGFPVIGSPSPLERLLAPRNTFIFDPSSPPAPNTNLYNDFALVSEAMGRVEGRKFLEARNSSGGVTLPLGNFPMDNVTLFARQPFGPFALFFQVRVPEGCKLPGLKSFAGPALEVRCQATLTPPIVAQSGDIFQISDGVVLTATGGVPLISGNPALTLGDLVEFFMSDVAELGTLAAGKVIDFPSATFVAFSLGSQAVAADNSYGGVVGTQTVINYRCAGATFSTVQIGYLGAFIHQVVHRNRMILGPVRIATFTAVINTVNRVNGTVGAFIANLPPAGNFPLQFLVIEEVSGGIGPITVDPNGAELINGSATFVMNVPRLSLFLFSTGVEWLIVAGSTVSSGALAFGLNFQSALSTGRNTTTLATFQTKTSLVTPAGLVGTFRVMATASIDSALAMQVRLQNVTDGVQLGLTNKVTPIISSDRLPWVAAGNVVFAGLAKTFEIQWRDNPPGGQTAGISEARIEFWRIF